MPHPIRGRTLSQMLRNGWSEFGQWRTGGKTHTGFDYYAPYGTPIYATGPGRVTYHGNLPNGYGHYVEVSLDSGYRTLDAHMREATPIARGTRVDANTIIGYVGASGNAAAITWYVNGQGLRHTHHEVRSGPSNAIRYHDPLVFHGAVTGAAGPSAPIPSTPSTPSSRKDHPAMYFMRTLNGSIFLVTDNGIVGIGNQDHLKLFQRLFASYPSWDTFNDVERDIIHGYLKAASTADDAETARIIDAINKAKPVVDTAALVKPITDAVAAAIKAQGVKVDLQPVLAAVATGFASVNKNIDDQPVNFEITPKA